jgi:hypothetical protein
MYPNMYFNTVYQRWKLQTEHLFELIFKQHSRLDSRRLSTLVASRLSTLLYRSRVPYCTNPFRSVPYIDCSSFISFRSSWNTLDIADSDVRSIRSIPSVSAASDFVIPHYLFESLCITTSETTTPELLPPTATIVIQSAAIAICCRG